MRFPFLLLPLAMMMAACSNTDSGSATAPAQSKPRPASSVSARHHDESSYARPDVVKISDLALDLNLDFDRKQLAGTATYTLDWADPSATQLQLDTRDLSIERAEGEKGGLWTPLPFTVADADPVFGSKLTIEAPERNDRIRVTYSTAPTASGLQWLEPAMTEGKTLPFMFSQSQAIHARSWVPLQDTPGVRFTYSAHVQTRPDAMVLMSADNDPAAVRDGDYEFKMPQAIPSYLLAIAAGDLVFQPISERSGVWAEPAMVEKAAVEFADTEKMIEVTEQLYGPYRWGRYDMLVLPPSFPFGGMENPRLTFATPTVIVGDKSLVSLIAHELAHSWSGNLVSNASWKDIWLNEGFTTYVQGRILEVLYGEDAAEADREVDQKDLLVDLKRMAPADQVLMLAPLGNRDPDEILSQVPYIKGAWFLQTLEQRFGRETFDPFLRGWFDQHAFQSVDSDQFIDYLKKNLMATNPSAFSGEELKAWMEQPGIPITSAAAARSNILASADTARIAWQGSGVLPSSQIVPAWGTLGWVGFLDGMGESLSREQLKQLDDAYHFTGTPNGEIAARWYPLTIRSGYVEARPAMADFLKRVGRRKLILPVYQELAKTPDGLAFAQAVFAEAQPGYHPITTASVKELLSRSTAR
ncbi:MAG: M1 family metallopeptidase [Xanthomonadaceae bacterium]|jgi:aminopeptidase N|nr:M1 family metallopeptidase [Xanthomonadaceae bacterium]